MSNAPCSVLTQAAKCTDGGILKNVGNISTKDGSDGKVEKTA
jgi:hypothetical protein